MVLLIDRLPLPLEIEAVEEVGLLVLLVPFAITPVVRFRLVKATIDGLGEFQTDGRFLTEEDFMLILPLRSFEKSSIGHSNLSTSKNSF
jgi:hypothetical protein